MGVVVDRGVKTHIRQNPDGFVLQVRDPSSPEAAWEAMREARRGILGLDGGPDPALGLGPGDRNGPKYVSVTPSPRGPAVYVDAGGTPMRLLLRIPDLLVAHLQRAGVSDARIVLPVPEGPDLDRNAPTRTVILRAYPPPRPDRRGSTPIPGSWLEEVVGWLGSGGEESVHVRMGSLRFPVEVAGLSELLSAAEEAKSLCLLFAGDPDLRIFGAHINFGHNLALAAGGMDVTDEQLLAWMDHLRGIARGIAPTASYVFIDFELTYANLNLSYHRSDWSSRRDLDEATWERTRSIDRRGLGQGLQYVADVVVDDAFPYQILGPGHLDRLGGPPESAVSLDDERWEITFGEPEAWIPRWHPELLDDRTPWRIDEFNPTRTQARAVARRELASCLLSFQEGIELASRLRR